MADISYQQAHKLGMREIKARASRHEDLYLPSLEELLPHLDSLNEEDLGSIRIDIDQIVGTRSTARREAFSPSFYPLLDDGSEFAAKWTALAKSHLKEGIQDPIVAVEYLNRFYVVEGHKRVSVLRFFGATTMRAEVKRLLPPKSDDPEIAVYYEFLQFYKVTRINNLRFNRLGAYPTMLKLLCGDDLTVWDEDRRRGFYSDVLRFRKAYAGSSLSGTLTQDEALMRYLEIFGAENLSSHPGRAEGGSEHHCAGAEKREQGERPGSGDRPGGVAAARNHQPHCASERENAQNRFPARQGPGELLLDLCP